MTQTNLECEATQTIVTVKGVPLRRRTEIGKRGGTNHIYQSVDASPVWGYWYHTAKQATEKSTSLDRMIRL